MRFEILGPLRVHTNAGEVSISSGRERTVLAVLLLHANRTVPNDQLIEAIWAEQPPPGARNQLQGCVSRLRKRLATTGLVIITEPAGYRANLPPTDLDLLEFRRLVSQARTATAAGDHPASVTSYRAALDLWRGPALGGIDTGPAHAAAALDEEHVQVQEEYIEAELTAGGAGRLVPELTELVGQHPHRERLHRALMLALYRAGRQADALAAYRHARTMLNDELGIEPGPELQRLHQAILNRDPDLDAPPIPAHASAASSAQPPVPRELPADVAGFTGRAEALQALDELLDREPPHGPPTPVVISAIAGMAGVGKTALAVHWAHRVADRYPDGQLYVNLRGFGPDRPMGSAEALARLLSTLGGSDQETPLESDDRAARYRSKLAGQRILILLDNAASAEQVRPLLPGAGSCTVVVTSRHSLAGLVALDGAHRLELGVLTSVEATTLLRKLIGHRVDAEPEAAAKLVSQCAQLPLALRIAAEAAASRSALSLAEQVAELEDHQRRLDGLDVGGDPHASVKVVFSWSVRHLSPDMARTFRLLGLHRAPDIDPYAAAALTNASLEQTRHTLDLLISAHLVHVTTTKRCGMHDLLRLYAASLTMTDYTEEERHAARGRLLDYYLATAAAAMDSLHPAETHHRPRVPLSATPTPDLSHSDAARAWLDAERFCLVEAVADAAAHNLPNHAIGLSATLFRYLDGGHFSGALAVHRCAHRAALQIGDVAEQAHALHRLGAVHDRMGQPAMAADHLRQALTLFRCVGDRGGEAVALNSLGSVERRHGRFSADHHQRALTLFRRTGDRTGEASALTSLGLIGRRRGRREAAADHLRRAVTLSRQVGDHTDEAFAVNHLGSVEQDLGNYASAIDCHEQAIALFRRLGSRLGEASATDNLGTDYLRLGRPDRAAEVFDQALTIFRELGDREGEAAALNGHGEAANIASKPATAAAYHTDALVAAAKADIPYEQARAHRGLATAHEGLGDAIRARGHYERAIALYTQLDMPDSEQVRARLADLNQRQTASCSDE